MRNHPSPSAVCLVLLLLASLTGAACSSHGGGNADASHDYLTFDVAFGDLPPGCPPAAANDKGIGGPCTMGGNECKNDLICACEPHAGIQPPDGTPCVCTRLMLTGCSNVNVAQYCGQGAACCSYMDQASICVPLVCLPDGTCPAI